MPATPEHEPPHDERAERMPRVTAVSTEDIVHEITWRVAIPTAEGYLAVAQRQLADIFSRIHGCHTTDPIDDPISSWLDDDILCGQLNRAGIFVMSDLMSMNVGELLAVPQVGEIAIQKITKVKKLFDEKGFLLEQYRDSAKMSE